MPVPRSPEPSARRRPSCRKALCGLDDGRAGVARFRNILWVAQSVAEHLLDAPNLFVAAPHHRAVLIGFVQPVAQCPAARAAPSAALDEPARLTRFWQVSGLLELALVPNVLFRVGEVLDTAGG